MTDLQKIVLGTPPKGDDGDTVRVGNTKANANVDVLNAQAVLTSVATITAAQTLTGAHVGKRVNVNLAAAGIVCPPAASSCTPDSVIFIRNIGATVVSLAPAAGSGDTVSLAQLNPVESVLIDTDGMHKWSVMERSRAATNDESVIGNLTVGGSASIAGRVMSLNGQNLLVNGSGELGNLGWATSVCGAATDINGANFFTNAAAITAGTSFGDLSAALPAVPGTTVSVAGEVYTAGMTSGDASLYFSFFDGTGTQIGQGSAAHVTFGKSWTPQVYTMTVPAGAITLKIGKGGFSTPRAPAGGMGFRRIKFEIGAPSLYSDEASLAYLKTYADATASANRPPGEISFWALSIPPAGWLKCNGSAVSRATYAALFSAIGTTFGAGDGATTFNVPELRGEFVRVLDDGRGVDAARTLGSAQVQDMQPHVHGPGNLFSGGAANSTAAPETNPANTLSGAYYSNASATSALNLTGRNTGSAGATETRPRNVAFPAFIKY